MFEGYSWFSKLPSNTLSECTENLRQFFEVMYERQLIWKRRFLDKKERPWTDNKIFQESKFTNVYRELDRNSQWQIKNIILDDSLSEKDLIWKMMVFRFFNCPETFEMGKKEGWKNGIPSFDEYDEEVFANFIKKVRKSGQNPYTTAYLINSGKNPRDYHYTHIVIPTLHSKIEKLIETVKNAEKPEDIIKFLLDIPAVAMFIAHEFYQDFTYIPRYTNRTFMKFTQNDFTNVGPGCSVGIRLVYPSLNGIPAQKKGIYWLRDRAEEELAKIAEEKGEPFPFLEWDKKKKCYYIGKKCNITLHQIEMWLCEYQKYWKMEIGMGKQRSKFEPRTKEL